MPKSDGRATFVMGLLKESDPNECIYEMTVLMEVIKDGSKLNASLLSAGGKAFQGAVSGEGADFSYAVQRNEYGNIVVTVTDKNYVETTEEDEREESAELKEQGLKMQRASNSLHLLYGRSVRNFDL